ncbi:YVTN family beta-propeller protein [Pontibacter aydingkolensis]|uniref:40-residue YVTN family beta-propeller repeat-containing protein n=1 Tax=Pontibacter aydingkolensis TaxID=1911536 RepID=A0ABS7CQH2_9BACT|nr:DUF5074 domain-containing protein [Pontibacter aydingkolensis]MBW7465777.1 hypothetical protein [Pontibacter aydingkolensis]
MKKNSLFRSLLTAAVLSVISLSFTSCDNEDSGPSGAYAENGVFVVNEGNFGYPTSSLSYYNKGTQEVQNNIFKKENQDRPLGDVAQSMAFHGDRAFIVVNNSNKIEVVNRYTFKSEGVIEGLSGPRYFVALNGNKGYVTEWLPSNPDWSYNNGRVSVIDLNTFTVLKTIQVGLQPEKLLIAGGKVYVTNSGGSTITVISTVTDAIEKNISVTHGPNSLVLDKNNALWVLSSGFKNWQADPSTYSAAALTKIITTANEVTGTYTFPEVSAGASKLVQSGAKDALYYSYGGKVYRQPIASESLSHTMVIDKNFYGIGVDPETGYIYGGDANGFTGDGTVYVYNTEGTKVTEFRVGIAPNGFVFN